MLLDGYALLYGYTWTRVHLGSIEEMVGGVVLWTPSPLVTEGGTVSFR
jgi:hypothetical protein